ncbi:SAM-dependent methyltransferase [Micromonospora sp. LOL_024]|uniref:SAM-dependent methyltransferase n=1 Tax=Micromonospora sp. LOL_024 TaxID=3345412 RepID=UPI003A8A6B8C
MWMRWRDAMQSALYGAEGFFVSGRGPAAHFRTSVHASPIFASALLQLIHHLDAALDFPDRFDVVDVGAGRGELLRALSVGVNGEPAHSGQSGLIPARPNNPETPTTTAAVHTVPDASGPWSSDPSPAVPVPLARRVRFTAVELAPRPDDLPQQIIWTNAIPADLTGLLLATEWLDNVPLDLATRTEDRWHHLLVDPATGHETTGEPVSHEDAAWLQTWWLRPREGGPAHPPPTVPDGQRPTRSDFRAAPTDPTPTDHSPTAERAEIGRTRDEAWADAVGHVDRGLALAVDYGHLLGERPPDGTLTGYRGGRQVRPVPDGSCDVTAHVAIDAVASAGARVARCAYSLGSQRDGLRALGADSRRPPLSMAAGDPTGYVRALAEASAAAELTDPAGLGGHWWLWQAVGLPVEELLVRDTPPAGRSGPGS